MQDETTPVKQSGSTTHAAFPPEGWVTVVDAARMLGVARVTFKRWVSEGKAPRPRWVAWSDERDRWAYAVEDVERTKAERAVAVALRSAVPEGFVDVREACAILNASPSALTEWQRQGKIGFA